MDLDLKALKDYGKWLDKSPEEVLLAVKTVGGWAAVFPDDFPLWAHQVRNFFNQEPMTLRRFDEDFSKSFLDRVQRNLNALNRDKYSYHSAPKWLERQGYVGPLPAPSLRDDIAETLALSGDVYKDEFNRIWYQMSPGGTIYHWGEEPQSETIEAIVQTGKQELIPVFKLISPDDTGGSRETIIQNPLDRYVRRWGVPMKVGRSSIGKVNVPEPVHHRIVTEPWHQGSYNYSETIEVGFAAHKKRDMDPHDKHPTAYFNPPSRFMPLAQRRFPKLKL